MSNRAMSAISQREEDLFDQARRIDDAAARTAFLDGACDGDAALRRRIEDLLKAESAAEEFFAEGRSVVTAPGGSFPFATAAIASDLPGEETIGTRIGRYKLLEKIGEGGCGIVYMAEQEEPVRRRVALKVIKLGMDTKTVIARF